MNTTVTTAGDERDLVRELARQVAAIAASPENEAIRRRWRDVNALRAADRWPVWCRPVGAWDEILTPDKIVCQDRWLRRVERGFRQDLYKHDMADDSPLEPCFEVGAAFDVEPANYWGVDIRHRSTGADGGAWAFDPPLRSEADFDALRLPSFTYNEEETQRQLERADELLGDILPVRLVCGPPLNATLGSPAVGLRALEQLMLDMMDQPKLMHGLMAHIRDAVLRSIDQSEATGLVTPNHTGPMTCSDPIPAPPGAAGDSTCLRCWCCANSQEFDQVSPAMWEEFCLDYQRPILERFGLVQYGCCENLTEKIDGVLSIPNLRVFVCSAWTNLENVVDRIGRRHTIMWRQKASDVVIPDDVATIKRDLDEGMRRLQGCHAQIVLRELQTLAGHADRLHVWTDLAKEAAAKYAS